MIRRITIPDLMSMLGSELGKFYKRPGEPVFVKSQGGVSCVYGGLSIEKRIGEVLLGDSTWVAYTAPAASGMGDLPLSNAKAHLLVVAHKGHYRIELEMPLDKIINKQFRLCRPQDLERVVTRYNQLQELIRQGPGA